MNRQEFELLLVEDFQPSELHSVTQFARCGCNNTCNCTVSGVNTDCAKTTIGGLGTPISPYTIKVTPVISPDTGNSLVCRGNGLFAQGVIIVGDTDNDNCVNITATQGPVGTFTLEGSLIVSPDVADPNGGANAGNGAECLAGTGLLVAPSVDPDNLLKFGPDGRLEVTCEDVQDCIGKEIGPALAGTCLEYNDAANKIDIVICDDPTNILTCNPAGSTNPNCTNGGLFVPPSPTVVHVVDNAQNIDAVVGPNDTITFTCVAVPVTTSVDPGGPCIAVTGDTCNGLHIALGISTDDCQGLQCRGNGLWAERYQPTQTAPQSGACYNGPGPGNIGPTVFGPILCRSITNNSCHPMAIWINDEPRDIIVNGHTTGFWHMITELSFDGGATFGLGSWSQSGRGPSVGGFRYEDQVGTYHREAFTIGPGATANICSRTTFDTGGGFNGTIGMCHILGLEGFILP